VCRPLREAPLQGFGVMGYGFAAISEPCLRTKGSDS